MRRFLTLLSVVALTVVGVGGVPGSASAAGLFSVDAPSSGVVGGTVPVTVTTGDGGGLGDISITSADQVTQVRAVDGVPVDVPISEVGVNTFVVDYGPDSDVFTVEGVKDSSVLTLTGPDRVVAGSSVNFTVGWVLASGQSPEGVVVLEKQSGDGWVEVASWSGAGSHQVVVDEGGVFRVLDAGTDTRDAGVSNTVTVDAVDEASLADPVLGVSAAESEVPTDGSTVLTVSWENSEGVGLSGTAAVQQRIPGGTWDDVYTVDVVDGVGTVEVWPYKATEYRLSVPATVTSKAGVSAPVTVTAVAADDEAVVGLTGPEFIATGGSAVLVVSWAAGNGVLQSGDVMLQQTSAEADFEWADVQTVTVTGGVGSVTVTPSNTETFYRVVTPANDTVSEGVSEPWVVTVDDDAVNPGGELATSVVTLTGPTAFHGSKTLRFNIGWVDDQDVKQDGVVAVEATDLYSNNWQTVREVMVRDGVGSFTYPMNRSMRLRVVTTATDSMAAGQSADLAVTRLVAATDALVQVAGPFPITNVGSKMRVTGEWRNEQTGVGQSGKVRVQFRKAGASTFKTVATVKAKNGVFTTKIKVPGDGDVRVVTPATRTTTAGMSDLGTVQARYKAVVKVSGPKTVLAGRPTQVTFKWENRRGDKVTNDQARLQTRKAGVKRWSDVDRVSIEDGVGVFTVYPTVKSEYRLVTPVLDHVQAGVSKTYKVSVKAAKVKFAVTGDSVITNGDTGSLHVQMVSEDAYPTWAPVKMQKKVGKKWVTVESSWWVWSAGRYVTVQPTETTKYRFVFKGSSAMKATTSKTFTVTVQ